MLITQRNTHLVLNLQLGRNRGHMGIIWWIVIITAISGIGGTGLGGFVGAILRRDSKRW